MDEKLNKQTRRLHHALPGPTMLDGCQSVVHAPGMMITGSGNDKSQVARNAVNLASCSIGGQCRQYLNAITAV
ncbi:hypothetical protein IFT74_21210 [Oxalobacteraceae sp. CFBP 8755]|nr:hypothetical protein [Oxalobacteraceae sp. CFBP 8755]